MPKFKDTKVGKFLKKLGKPVDGILDFAADVTGIEALDALGDVISGSDTLTPQEKDMALEELKIDLEYYREDTKDRASARDLQKTAIREGGWLAENFIYLLAAFWSIVAAAFIFIILFKEIPSENTRLVDTITGFLLGTIVASIVTFFFGSSLGSKIKDKVFKKGA